MPVKTWTIEKGLGESLIGTGRATKKDSKLYSTICERKMIATQETLPASSLEGQISTERQTGVQK